MEKKLFNLSRVKDIFEVGKITVFMSVFLSCLILLTTFAPKIDAAVHYPPGSLLQPGDVTSTHIRDDEIVNADIKTTAAIAWSKIDKTGSSLADLATRAFSATTGTVGVTRGGTGLTTIADGSMFTATAADTVGTLAKGTANQIIGMNNGATTQEYKTVTAGTGITVTQAAGSITIGATGIPYAADAGISDAYAVTYSPAPTSYSVGTIYSFRANTANTGAATLNINSLGAIPIYKKMVAELANNDILAGQMVVGIINNILAANQTWDNYAPTITQNRPIQAGGNTAEAQSFTAVDGLITSAKVKLFKEGSPTGSAYAKIYAHSGTYGTNSVPTGAALATSDAFDVSTLTGSYQEITFAFSGANQIRLTGGQYYVLAIEYAGGGGADLIKIGGKYDTPTHSGNQSGYNGTWSARTEDLWFTVIGSSDSYRMEMISQISN